jgi:hypothetical protein
LRPDKRFVGQAPSFWAHVRLISEKVGYTVRGQGTIRVPSAADMRNAMKKQLLSVDHLLDADGQTTELGQLLLAYFEHRAKVLNSEVQPMLMDAAQAKQEFAELKRKLNPECPLPMNKQRGKKRNHAFLTGMVNMLVEAAIQDAPCDFDPRSLTTVTHDSMPLRTLARRVDGAFPSTVNPIAIWEIKEYYYTTTFGSRVADGIYETLLDGMELLELEQSAGRSIDHVLFVDARYTWWDCGRSYLCRIIDMLHMGYVDEVIFGREVLTRLPELAADWLRKYRTAATR